MQDEPASRKLRHFRRSRGWSQTELATQLGCDQPTVSSYERGKVRPDLERALRISEITGGWVAPSDWVDRAPA